jgi:type 1 fimbria pilin
MTPKAVCATAGSVLLCALAFAASSENRTFTGNISDSACGLHHTMGSNAGNCTLMCVQMGSKFVLADQAHHKVYALSDQAKARRL